MQRTQNRSSEEEKTWTKRLKPITKWAEPNKNDQGGRKGTDKPDQDQTSRTTDTGGDSGMHKTKVCVFSSHVYGPRLIFLLPS